MTDGYDPVQADAYLRSVLFDEWRQQLGSGSLTLAGVCRLRGLLDSAMFLPGADLELLGLDVDDAVAGMLGVDPADMPGAPSFPDSPAGL